MTLLDDLNVADSKARSRRPITCAACDLLESVEDEATKRSLSDALAGTIGVQTLCKILRANGYTTVGRRTIEHHRREGHTS